MLLLVLLLLLPPLPLLLLLLLPPLLLLLLLLLPPLPPPPPLLFDPLTLTLTSIVPSLPWYLYYYTCAVLAAEVVHSYLPGIVELHNYSAANSVTQKEYNWVTLNDKVFRKFGFRLSSADIEQIVRARPGVIERTLLNLEDKLEAAKRNGISKSRGPSAGGSRGQRGAQQGRVGSGKGRHNRNERNRQQPAGSKFNEPRRGGGATRVQAQPVQQQQQQRRMQQEPQWNTNEVPPQAQIYPDNMQREVDQEILLEKEQEVQELRETIDVRACSLFLCLSSKMFWRTHRSFAFFSRTSSRTLLSTRTDPGTQSEKAGAACALER